MRMKNQLTKICLVLLTLSLGACEQLAEVSGTGQSGGLSSLETETLNWLEAGSGEESCMRESYGTEPDLSFLSDEAYEVHLEIKSLFDQFREEKGYYCAPDESLQEEIKSQLDELCSSSLSDDEKKDEAKSIFKSYKELVDADRASMEDCVSENLDYFDAIHENEKALHEACLLEKPKRPDENRESERSDSRLAPPPPQHSGQLPPPPPPPREEDKSKIESKLLSTDCLDTIDELSAEGE